LEISLAEEHAFHYIPQFTLEVAHDRVEQRKVQLVAGTVGSLLGLGRLKPEDIRNLGVENRLEPFWLVSVSSHTVFDRNRSYTVPVSGPEVDEVTILGQKVAVDTKEKHSTITVNAVEHCQENSRVTRSYQGVQGEPGDPQKYTAFPKTIIVDLNTFAPEGVLVVPPQLRATAVARQVIGEVIRPVQNAHTIYEERVNIETLDLNFRPVYAFEYEWASKAKRTVIEFNALTGEINAGGRRYFDQLKGIVTRDLIFDVTADAVGMLVPGGSIAVKLVKAVVDRKQ
jgi:hypothetical protein